MRVDDGRDDVYDIVFEKRINILNLPTVFGKGDQ